MTRVGGRSLALPRHPGCAGFVPPTGTGLARGGAVRGAGLQRDVDHALLSQRLHLQAAIGIALHADGAVTGRLQDDAGRLGRISSRGRLIGGSLGLGAGQ